MELTEITDASFAEAVAGGVTLVDCWAPWCAPCKALKPILEELAAEYSQISFTTLNVDENPVTAGTFRVLGLPTVLIFKDGQVTDTVVGLKSRADFAEILSSYSEQ